MLARRPWQTCGVANRRERLASARLYLVCDARSDDFVRASLAGGVDIVQLRMKDAGDAEIVAAGRRFAQVCSQYGALLIIDDRADLVDAAGADGVHVGQDDMPTADARAVVGAERLIGLSTHSEQQIDEAGTDVDYIGVGPVYCTPTKPGRPAVGIDLISYAAARAPVPFFAIGGVDTANVSTVHAAGATRIAVVRALTEAADPRAVARALRGVVTPALEKGARVGAA
jgi:thiamine-phosphate pyrophosphorylase